MKKTMIKSVVMATLLILPTMSIATQFYKSGTIKRILVDTSASYGKCMVQLPSLLGNGCSSSWVSLDCAGKYLVQGDGDRMLNIALIAQTMGKTVSLRIDNTKKHGGYCVASRMDILK